MYYLINTMDATEPYLGRVLSVHRSREAAEAADSKLQRSIKRSEYNGSTSYLPTRVVESAERLSKGDLLER